MINAFTIDVEDYWNVVSRDWLNDDFPPTDAVVRNTQWFLQTLDDHNTKATFFILGEVAQKFPELVKEVAQQGHEIGVHGFHHRQVFKLTPDQFRTEIIDAKKLLEDLCGSAIIGHRAPAFSINADTQWALEILAELGFQYDSSIFPIAGRRYGWPEFSHDICKVELSSGKSIIEVPMSTVNFFGRDCPAAGGGYFRHFPYAVTHAAIRKIQKKRPVIVYMHPYEIDTALRPFCNENISAKEQRKATRFHRLQLRNRRFTKAKVLKLMSDFKFTSLENIIRQYSKE